jgi:aminomethyltransferase
MPSHGNVAQDATAAAYKVALEDALAVRHESPGVLRLTGSGVVDFLHRMSTNDLLHLSPGEIRGTVLTTAIGRTVDVVSALCRTSDLLLLTSSGRADSVREWLSRYIFFNDDVTIEVPAGEWSLWGVYGPQADAALRRLAEPPVSSFSFTETGDAALWRTASPVQGIRALAGAEMTARAESVWGDTPGGEAARGAYDILRVERGQPAVGREIDEEVIPLEVGLRDLVSFTKGCYIGQEIIARMESRGRIARQLVGVRMAHREDLPQEVILEGQTAGRLTSAVVSPRFGPIGLAVVRPAALGREQVEVTLSPAGSRGRLTPLPFDQTIPAGGGPDRASDMRQV